MLVPSSWWFLSIFSSLKVLIENIQLRPILFMPDLTIQDDQGRRSPVDESTGKEKTARKTIRLVGLVVLKKPRKDWIPGFAFAGMTPYENCILWINLDKY